MTQELVLDFETYFDDEYQLKRYTTQEYIMDDRFHVHGASVSMLDSPHPVWLEGDSLTAFIRRMIPKCILVNHNAKFDAAILAWRYGVYPLQYRDTLPMSRALIGTALSTHSLNSVATSMGLPGKTRFLTTMKGVRHPDAQQHLELVDGCNHDVDMTVHVYNKLAPLFPPKEFEVVDWSIRAFVQPGLILNRDRLAAYYNKVIEGKQAALEKAGLQNRDVLMSNPQYAVALEALGVSIPMKTSPATGKSTFAFAKTDEGHKALLEHDNPDVQALVAARMENKTTIEETRAAAYWRASALGSWPVDLNYCGAQHTHRMSGGSGGGGNAQNLKRKGELRNCVEAPPGYVLIVGDLRQVELRITLKYAGEEEKLAKLVAGEDIYQWFASIMYGRPVDNPSVERQVGKSAVLGLGFGMGADAFHAYCHDQGILISIEDAQRAVDLYRSLFSLVPKLWNQCERVIRAMFEGQEAAFPQAAPKLLTQRPAYINGSSGIRLPSGLHLKYHLLHKMANGEWMYDRAKRSPIIFGSEITANIVQATAADIIKEKVLTLDKIFRPMVPEHVCPVPLVVHDEAVVICPESKAEIGKAIVERVMSTSPVWWADLPLDTEVKVSRIYGQAK